MGRRRRSIPLLLLLGTLPWLPGTRPAWAQADAPAASPGPALAIESVAVTPSAPGPDTLCQLRVKIHNLRQGDRQASAFGFDVKLNGRALPVYAKQLYLQTVPAGAASELRLFNFWTTESGRPAPADGKLKVEVTLREGRWVELSRDGKADVWTPAGPIEGLPVSAAVTLDLRHPTPAKPAPPPR